MHIISITLLLSLALVSIDSFTAGPPPPIDCPIQGMKMCKSYCECRVCRGDNGTEWCVDVDDKHCDNIANTPKHCKIEGYAIGIPIIILVCVVVCLVLSVVAVGCIAALIAMGMMVYKRLDYYCRCCISEPDERNGLLGVLEEDDGGFGLRPLKSHQGDVEENL